MKLNTFAQGSRNGTSHYGITATDRKFGSPARRKVIARLRQAAPRIEAMSRRQLGQRFLSVEQVFLDSNELLVLNVQVGTSKAEESKYEFRELLGWINLCMFE